MASATANDTTAPEKKKGSALAKETATRARLSITMEESMNRRQKSTTKLLITASVPSLK